VLVAAASVLVVNVSLHLNALMQINVLLVLLMLLPNVAELILLSVLPYPVNQITVTRRRDVKLLLIYVKPMKPAPIGIVIPLPRSAHKRKNLIMNSLFRVKMSLLMNVKMLLIV
jgi:hypothetical protein